MSIWHIQNCLRSRFYALIVQGPTEKPLLCNACGAHFLVKKSLDGYMPGQRASSITTSGNSHQSQQRGSHKQRQRHLQQLQHPDNDVTGSTASSTSAGSSVEQDGLEVEQPALVSSRKRSRLVSCSVFEVSSVTPTRP